MGLKFFKISIGLKGNIQDNFVENTDRYKDKN